jgi:hypothetical protein
MNYEHLHWHKRLRSGFEFHSGHKFLYVFLLCSCYLYAGIGLVTNRFSVQRVLSTVRKDQDSEKVAKDQQRE